MNPRLIKTKESLLEALTGLLKERSLEEITVSDLCKEAGINRTTFYKYYSVPDDVIVEAAQKILADIMYTDTVPAKSVYEYMLRSCEVAYANQKLMAMAIDTRTNLLAMFLKVAEQQYDVSFMRNSTHVFIAGGILAILSSWLQHGCREKPKVIALELTDYVKKLLN